MTFLLELSKKQKSMLHYILDIECNVATKSEIFFLYNLVEFLFGYRILNKMLWSVG